MPNHFIDFDIPVGSKLRIGVPAEQPEQSISALQAHFLVRKAVEAAYLGMIQVSPPHKEPYFTFSVGIHCDAAAFAEEQSAALDVLFKIPAEQLPVSVLPFTEAYFTQEAIRFYERQLPSKKVSLFTRLFSRG
jgi:hypothetical protein